MLIHRQNRIESTCRHARANDYDLAHPKESVYSLKKYCHIYLNSSETYLYQSLTALQSLPKFGHLPDEEQNT